VLAGRTSNAVSFVPLDARLAFLLFSYRVSPIANVVNGSGRTERWLFLLSMQIESRCCVSVRSITHLVCLLLLAALGAAADDVHAQTYPSRPIRLILSFPRAAGTDLLGRTSVKGLPKNGGSRWSSTTPGRERRHRRACCDDRRARRVHALRRFFRPHDSRAEPLRQLPYDTVKDFVPVISLANQYYILVVHPSVPATSVKEFIALAKAKPGQLNFSSPGTGTGGISRASCFKR
jgi:hypothetical protein